MEKERLTPLVDRGYLTARLNGLLTTLGPMESYKFYLEGLLRPARVLTYHIVIRYEAPEASIGVLDIHIPETNGSNVRLPGSAAAYRDALNATLEAVGKLNGLLPESEANRADLLIHINLAERRQTSEGFNYETMPRLPQRTAQSSLRADLAMTEYVLPWTFVRLYYADPRTKATGNARSIEGGEIWIQYSKRTFWEAEIARIALDMPDIATSFGLGTTRESIVSRFRTPHKTTLQPLKQALSPLRQSVWIGAGGRTDLHARPKETLLTLATGAMQHVDGAIYELGPPLDGRCGETAHSSVLAGRLGRAMAMFIGAIGAGALRVAPAGDYSSEFEKDPDGLLADFSLADYRGSFDQRLDDRLVLIGLEEIRAAQADGYRVDGGAMTARAIDRRIEDIRNMLRDVALGFTPDGGGCFDPEDLQ